MQAHSLTVLGLEVSFKAEADPGRVTRACALLEEKYAKLAETGGHLSREKLLLFLALGLADDVLTLRDTQDNAYEQIEKLLGKIEKVL